MSHIIQRQIFDISHPDRSEAHELQNRVSRVFNTMLPGRYERLFDTLIDEQSVFRVDQLSIHLGTFRADWTDEELAYRVLDELENELKHRIRLHGNYAGAESYAAPEEQAPDDIELLKHFLLTGGLPWWSGNRFSQPQALLERIYAGNAQALRSMLLQIGIMANVRRRIAYQFSSYSIGLVVKVLEPAEAAFIISYHVEIAALQEEEQTANYETAEVEKAVWAVILEYLFMLRGNVFNRKEFVKQTLGAMAAHFNLAYSILLELFFAALANSRPAELVTGLPEIIKELTQEEGLLPQGDVPLASSADTDSRLTLIRYFLLTGSLPAGAAQTMGTDDMAHILLLLIRQMPEAVKSLVLAEGPSNQQFRRRIAVSFDDEAVSAVVTLLEPAGARFIIEYAREMHTVQKVSPIVTTENAEFKKSVWEVILDFLLVERGSVFNATMFLQSTIQSLAARYNLAYTEVLRFLIKGIKEQALAEHVKLFTLLATLLEQDPQHAAQPGSRPGISNGSSIEDEDGPYGFAQIDADHEWLRLAKPGKDADHAGRADAPERSLARRISLRNFLRYWLTYGHFPWWGTEWYNIPPERMIEQLARQSAADARLLLKTAAANGRIKYRLLHQVPQPAIIMLLTAVKPAAGAIKMYHQLRRLLQAGKTIPVNDPEGTGRVLLLVLWDSIVQGNYLSVDLVLYISNSIHALSAHFGLPVQRIKRTLLATAGKEEGFEAIAAMLEHEQQGPAFMNGNDLIFFMDEEITGYDSQALALAIDALAERSVGNAGASRPEIGLYMLRHYLEHQSFPPGADHSRQTGKEILKQLVLYLYSVERQALLGILRAGKYAAGAAMQLHEIFYTVNTGNEAQVKKLLSGYFERDLTAYIVQGMSSSGPGRQSLNGLIALLHTGDAGAQALLRTLSGYAAAMGYIALHVPGMLYKLPFAGNTGWGQGTGIFLQELEQLISSGFSDTLERDRFSVLFNEYVLLLAAGRAIHADRQSFIRGVLYFIAARRNQSVYQLSQFLKPVAEKDGADMLSGFLLTELNVISEQENDRKSVEKQWEQADKRAIDRLKDPVAMKDNDIAGKRSELPVPATETAEAGPEPGPIAMGDKIYIDNAGMVLLHPFLNTYYQRLGMLKDGDFITEKARERAVHLLQYIVYGTEHHPEHELVLNKLLCGMPLEQAISIDISCTEIEKTVSEELLKAVCMAWDKLKNTSIESLRASFLQRRGALEHTGDVWTLKVEQRGYDVLLQTLPWSMAMIKNTWMREMVCTEWI